MSTFHVPRAVQRSPVATLTLHEPTQARVTIRQEIVQWRSFDPTFNTLNFAWAGFGSRGSTTYVDDQITIQMPAKANMI